MKSFEVYVAGKRVGTVSGYTLTECQKSVIIRYGKDAYLAFMA